MFKKLLILSVVISSIVIASEKYSDGRPKYDNEGHMIIWNQKDVDIFHRVTTNNTINNQFSAQAIWNSTQQPKKYSYDPINKQYVDNSGCILN